MNLTCNYFFFKFTWTNLQNILTVFLTFILYLFRSDFLHVLYNLFFKLPLPFLAETTRFLFTLSQICLILKIEKTKMLKQIN